MIRQTTTDVLIVGAGPTGLSLALDLARRGVRFRIVDQVGPPDTARSTKVGRTISRPLADRPTAGAQIIPIRGDSRPTRVYGPEGSLVDLGSCPTTCADTFRLGSASAGHHDAGVRSFLAHRVAELGCTIEYSTTLVDLVQRPSQVRATVKKGGRLQDIWAAFVVAADGARSTIRGLLSEHLWQHKDFAHRIYKAELDLHGLDPERSHLWMNEQSVLRLTGPRRDEHFWQLDAAVREPSDAVPTPALMLFRKLLAERAGTGHVQVPFLGTHFIDRASVRAVERYRVNRVLIAGDAAHVFTPSVNRSLAAAFKEVERLGWRLAAVLGGADDDLLDAYEEKSRIATLIEPAFTSMWPEAFFASK